MGGGEGGCERNPGGESASNFPLKLTWIDTLDIHRNQPLKSGHLNKQGIHFYCKPQTVRGHLKVP